MGKVAVVYWSGTGNTEAMAGAVAAGARAAGAEAELIAASDFDAGRVAEPFQRRFAGIAGGSHQNHSLFAAADFAHRLGQQVR